MSNPLAVIPAYARSEDDMEVLETCVSTLRASAPEVDILVVDDCSPYHWEADLDGQTEVIKKEVNEGFSKTVNVGLDRAMEEDRDAILVNADIEFLDHGWLKAMQESPGDVVGALLFYPDRTVQHAGVYFSALTRGWDHWCRGAPADLPDLYIPRKSIVTGALQYIRCDTLVDVGFYDPGFPLAFEDVDYCLRAWGEGKNVWYEPRAIAIHHEMKFRGTGEMTEREEKSWFHFCEKWSKRDFKEFMPW